MRNTVRILGLFVLILVAFGTLSAKDNTTVPDIKRPSLTASQIYLIAGAGMDLGTSWYVTRELESRGYTTTELSPLYGQRFDSRDIAIGAGIVAGVVIAQKIKPGWKYWPVINKAIGSIRLGCAVHNLYLVRTLPSSRNPEYQH